MYKLSQAAEAAGVAVATLGSWVDRRFIPMPKGGTGNHREFDLADVDRIAIVAELVRLGLPIARAAKAASEFSDKRSKGRARGQVFDVGRTLLLVSQEGVSVVRAFDRDEFEDAGEHFGVFADAMRSALNNLSAQMPQFKNKTSELYRLLSQRWPTLTEKLLGEGTSDQINDIIKFLGQLKNQPQLQKQLASEFFGNGDEIEKLFKNGADGFWTEFNKQQKLLNPINPELLKQSQNFLDATIKFKDTLENFENSAGPLFLKTMTGLVDKADEFVKLLEGPSANGGWLGLYKKGLSMTTIGQLELRAYKELQDKLHGKSSELSKTEAPHSSGNSAGALQGQDEFRKRLDKSLQNSNPLFSQVCICHTH